MRRCRAFFASVASVASFQKASPKAPLSKKARAKAEAAEAQAEIARAIEALKAGLMPGEVPPSERAEEVAAPGACGTESPSSSRASSPSGRRRRSCSRKSGGPERALRRQGSTVGRQDSCSRASTEEELGPPMRMLHRPTPGMHIAYKQRVTVTAEELKQFEDEGEPDMFARRKSHVNRVGSRHIRRRSQLNRSPSGSRAGQSDRTDMTPQESFRTDYESPDGSRRGSRSGTPTPFGATPGGSRDPSPAMARGRPHATEGAAPPPE